MPYVLPISCIYQDIIMHSYLALTGTFSNAETYLAASKMHMFSHMQLLKQTKNVCKSLKYHTFHYYILSITLLVRIWCDAT